jgi:ABC-type transport system involved in multi-copper enzyme maturation permease subunit
MTTRTYQSPVADSRDRFGQTVRAEWTKLRTMRGWLIGLLLAAVLPAGFAFLGRSSCASQTSGPNGRTVTTACPGPAIGPNGEAVNDTFFFVHRPLTGSGSLTVRLTSLTGLYPRAGYDTTTGTAGWSPGLQPWSKVGITIKENTAQGSAYAAIMLTGSHGVHFQYNFLHDVTEGSSSAKAPVWLRLTRSGDTITGYSSADGVQWTEVGSGTLTGLGSTAQIGMFAASPGYVKQTSSRDFFGAPSQATGVFDRVSLSGGTEASWNGTEIGGGNGDAAVDTGIAGWTQSGGTFTVQGSGDIAPDVGQASPGGGGPGGSIDLTLVGDFVGLIALIVIAAMFMTSEYRRGLIRVTFAASPNRGRVLAAKAIVIAAVTFVAALIGTTLALAVGVHMLHSGGVPILPIPKLTLIRIVAGTAAVFAVAAVLTLALAALLRRTAVVVVLGIVVFVLGWLLTRGGLLPVSVAEWILRLTPAAAYAVQQSIPAYSFVAGQYTPANGFYPLAPWAGVLVLCLWAAAALGLAIYVMNRRDA